MEKASKKTTTAAPGKTKVIRRLVKNAKTGEIIKTEIVRIDSSGEKTVTSYPAGTPVPSLSSLQSQSSQVKKTSTRKSSVEAKPSSPSLRRTSKEDAAPAADPGSRTGAHDTNSDDSAKPLKSQLEPNHDKLDGDDVGPSVPANVPGLEDLIKKEEELRRISESGLDQHEKAKPKVGEESLETALISIMKRKRQRDPKAKRRGLVASTMARRLSDEELDKALDEAYEDTDYRTMHSKKDDNQEDEEAERRRKERHRRRKEKKQKERSQVDRDDVEEYQGETGPLNLPEIDSYRKRDGETPMEGVESGNVTQVAESDEKELSKKLEDTSIKQEGETALDQIAQEKDEDESGSDDDKKKKKKKHKHKKKKKKTKKQKKRESKSGSEKEEEKEDKERRKSKSRSRSRSLSSLSMSSISSAFSDSFDFAGMNFDPSEDGGFDKALIEYQQIKEQVLGNQFMGRGFDPYFRGRGGFPRGRGGFPGARFPGPFPGPPWGGPGPMFHFFQPDPNFMFPPGAMGPDGEKGEKGRGRGVPANQGPWRGRGLRGRGVPPGFHRNYTEDEQGGGVYMEDSGSDSSSSGRKKKKKKHRRRSYSSSSYSSTGSSRSRSRSRRRHRRRHRSSSYSSRSSRSYSRSSYSSRSYRSYSRSSRSSYSRSSYSRSRSRSSRRSPSRDGSRKSWGYNESDRRASPSYHAYDEDGFKPPVREPQSDDEEVPWWAEFDKTYEVEKKKLEEEKKKLEEEEKAIKGELKEPQLPSIVSTDEIDVVRCVMTLVDKARGQQDEVLESARECINDIITKITTIPIQATQLHEEVEDPFDKVIHDCVDSILDRVCPNDPQTAARLCLKEIIDTVVEQEEEDKANEEATEMEKEITESAQSRLFQCYLKAQKLTEQIKAERRTKGLADDGGDGVKDENDEDKGKGDDRRRDKRGHRSRHRRRSRSRSRERGRRRRRHSSSDSRSRSSSRSSDARIPLVSKESLQQAQAVLMMQQQQLQVAGLLGTGMPNLAGLNQAAALAAGITPALLAQTGLKSSDLPSLTGEKAPEKREEESSKFTKWDKDKDAMSKKDDLTRKLMQRMREKKLKQEEGDASPTFQSRNKEKNAEVATTDKVFSGPTSLKSRKIAISSTFGKLWSKVEGSPKRDDDSQESKTEAKGYNKSEIIAATAEVKDQLQPSAERIKAEEQEKKLAAWSDEQAKLKEAAKREMREQIERAERAKKEQMKEEILEQERQKEIMRIREEVRSQIRKEIQEEIEKQRKSVLEDPAVRGKLLELEALRSQSGLIGSDGVPAAVSSSGIPASTVSATPAMTGPAHVRDQRWYQQQMKNKQDMQKWMESHGYYESEMDDQTMKRMQMTYMQNWTPAQKQGYMHWYWQQKQFPGPGYYPSRQQHLMGQMQTAASQGSAIPPLMGSRSQKPDFQSRDPAFTRAPSQPQRLEHGMPSRGRGVMGQMGQRLPYSQMTPQARAAAMMGHPQASVAGRMDRQGIQTQGYPAKPPTHPPPQYRESERPASEYNQEMRYDDKNWQLRQQQTGHALPQHAQLQPAQVHPQETQTQVSKVVDSTPNEMPAKVSGAPPNAPQEDQPPLHQYPPPGLEEDEQPSGGLVPPPAPQTVLKQVPVLDQPPPPGEGLENVSAIGVGGLAPPGEEGIAAVVPPGVQPLADDDSPSKSKKKKKQKKHRKHKKKKYSSSDDEDEKDPEAEKAAILAQLQTLKDVEDGEIASDDAAALAAMEPEKESRKKKKHKKEKKRHKKRKDDSSDEEPETKVPQSIPVQGAVPVSAGYYPPPGQVRPPFNLQGRQDFPGQMPNEHRPSDFPPHSSAERFGQGTSSLYPPPTAPFLGDRERPGFMPHPRDRRGAGEPQHMAHRPEQHQQSMGPGGDHNPPRKRTPSPLPLVIPTDPQEYEIWQRKMEARYNDGDPQKVSEQPGRGKHQDSALDQQLLKDIETIRRRHGERDLPGNANDDVIMMMRMIDEEQRRQRPPDHPLRESRKRGHGHMQRGRKRQRRLPRRNYHDWDKPEDDGLIFCPSGSDSSGWGSDSNMDFDRMLAKKRKEAEKRDIPHQRSPPHPGRSPGRMLGWERREMAPRKEEKPQGIPVIGGGPRPIPTNVSSSRPTPPHHHPDMIGAHGGLDFLPPDVLKLPPQFPPSGYPHDPHLMDQRRDPAFPPMPPSSAHPIPRLGPGAPPIPPMMLNPPIQTRMHPMDYRPRYPM